MSPRAKEMIDKATQLLTAIRADASMTLIERSNVLDELREVAGALMDDLEQDMEQD